jgi:hypothetical protein
MERVAALRDDDAMRSVAIGGVSRPAGQPPWNWDAGEVTSLELGSAAVPFHCAPSPKLICWFALPLPCYCNVSPPPCWCATLQTRSPEMGTLASLCGHEARVARKVEGAGGAG